MKCLPVLIFIISLNLHAQDGNRKILYAKTIGSLPFLEYGLGDDRLGGAKMTFLDSNIILKVIDSSGNDYKVQLSKNHSGYISKESVKPVPGFVAKPYYLSGNWKVYGDSLYDFVAITLDEKLPYRSRHEINPSRIVVDIFGATSNTNWITQLKTAKEIKNIYYDQAEDDAITVTIFLNHAQHWGHAIYYDTSSNRLMIRVKPQPSSTDIRKLKIAVDAGHGGDNIGAEGKTTHIREKEYTLLIAKELQATLKKAGVKNLFMTRTKDTSLSMPERLQMLNDFDPDLLISIHLNSSSYDTVKGVSTYYRYIGFRPLTLAIHNQLLQLNLNDFGNIGNFNFALNGPTQYPNCLVEVAFLTNTQDELKIKNPKFRKLVANKIYLGITDWLKQLK